MYYNTIKNKTGPKGLPGPSLGHLVVGGVSNTQIPPPQPGLCLPGTQALPPLGLATELSVWRLRPLSSWPGSWENDKCTRNTMFSAKRAAKLSEVLVSFPGMEPSFPGVVTITF